MLVAALKATKPPARNIAHIEKQPEIEKNRSPEKGVVGTVLYKKRAKVAELVPMTQISLIPHTSPFLAATSH